MSVAILFGLVVGFMLIGVPIAVSLGMSSVLFLLFYSDTSLASIAQTLMGAFVGHFTLLAIPFFILASSFMSTGAWRNGSSASPSPASVTCRVVWPSRASSPA